VLHQRGAQVEVLTVIGDVDHDEAGRDDLIPGANRLEGDQPVVDAAGIGLGRGEHVAIGKRLLSGGQQLDLILDRGPELGQRIIDASPEQRGRLEPGNGAQRFTRLEEASLAVEHSNGDRRARQYLEGLGRGLLAAAHALLELVVLLDIGCGDDPVRHCSAGVAQRCRAQLEAAVRAVGHPQPRASVQRMLGS
jgi:hypothetical protein